MPILTAKKGILYLDGKYCDHIGFNAYSMMEKVWANNVADTGYWYDVDFPLLKSKGIKVIKVMITPFSPTGASNYSGIVGTSTSSVLSTYYTGTVGKSYLDGIDTLFQKAIDNGIGILVGFLWNQVCIPDAMAGGSGLGNVSDWNDPTSTTRQHWRMFSDDFVKRYNTGGARSDLSAAIAGYTIWGESEIAIESRNNNSVSRKGLRLEGYSGAVQELRSAIKKYDTTGRILCGMMTDVPGIATLSGRQPFSTDLHSRKPYYDLFDVVGAHVYPGNKGSGRLVTPGAIRYYESLDSVYGKLKEYIKFSKYLGKPFILDEFGVSFGDESFNGTSITKTVTAATGNGSSATLPCTDTSGLVVGQVVSGTGIPTPAIITSISTNTNFVVTGSSFTGTTGTTVTVWNNPDTSNSMFQRMVDAIKNSGVQLSLAWNWNEHKYIPSQSVWSIYTNDSRGYHNTRYKQLDSIVTANLNTRVLPDANTQFKPTKFARIEKGRTFGLITSGNNVASILSSGNPNSEFSLCFWYRQNQTNENTSNYPAFMGWKSVSGANPGFSVQVQGVTNFSPYIEPRPAAGTPSILSTAGAVPALALNRWYHIAFTIKWSAVDSLYYANFYLNGLLLYTMTNSLPMAFPATEFVIGEGAAASVNSTKSLSVDLSEVMVHSQAISGDEIYNIFSNNQYTVQPKAYWKLDSVKDYSGSNLHLVDNSAGQIFKSETRTYRGL